MLTDPGASASLFATHFWGEKFNGFDVMYHNMKHGQKCSSEFLEMLRESCSIEETYHKSLTKLAKQIGGYSSSGTYVPLWTLLRQSIERLAVIHLELMQKWQTVSKDVLRYMDEQSKRHKAIKEAEGGTLEVVQSIQVNSAALLKAKDVYHSRYADYEKAKRNDSASMKDLDKTENKLKKAQDEYKYLIEKYNNNRNDFQKKMINSCRHFQEVEERHLEQMREYLRRYGQGWSMVHAELGKVYNEFEQSMEETTSARLLQKFVEERGTGREVPQPVSYEEAEVAAAFPPSTTNEIYGEISSAITPMATGGERMSRKASIGDLLDRISNYSDRSSDAVSAPNASSTMAPTSKKKEGSGGSGGGGGGGGFFRWRRNSIGEKSGKKKNSKSTSNLAQEAAAANSGGAGSKEGHPTMSRQPAVDDEGYSIPPVNPWSEPKGDSSSSEEDDDQDDRFRPPKVTIKPRDENAVSTEGNLDAIKATMELIRIASPTGNLGRRTPTANLPGVRKSTSVSDQLVSINDRSLGQFESRPCSDLLGLDFDGPPAPPTERARSALPSQPRPPSRARPRPRPETPDLLGDGGRSTSAAAAAMSPWASFDVAPSSPAAAPPLVPVANAAAISVMARGPSPAPLLSSEPLPIAVAFTETVLLHQRGASIDSYQMKVQGELAFAFPAGILRHLNSEFSPGLNPLVFSLNKTEKLLKYQINDKLTLPDNVEHTIRLNMSALGTHLRSLRDANPAATYFNVTVLRYELSEGSCRPPLLLGVHWRREAAALAYRIDFKTGWPLSRPEVSTPAPSVRLVCPMEGAVSEMFSKPDGSWTREKRLATWVVPAAQLSAAVDPSGCDGGGTIRARFNLTGGEPPPRVGTLSAQFLCEGASLSGMEMSLLGNGYRISLNKRRLISGKMYACEAGEEERQHAGFLPTL